MRRDSAVIERRAEERRRLLHALVLAPGGIYKDQLLDLLGQHQDEAGQGRLRNYLSDLRKYVGIRIDTVPDPIRIVPAPHLTIDLWQFLDYVERDGTELARQKARAMIQGGLEPALPSPNDSPDNPVWAPMFKRFEEARKALRAPRRPAQDGTLSSRVVARTQKALLEESIVRGIGRETPVANVYRDLRRFPIPWHDVAAAGVVHDESGELPKVIADTLEAGEEGAPQRVALIGGPGAGKSLVAALVFLELAVRFFVRAGDAAAVPVYVDAATNEGGARLGTNRWLRERLERSGIEPGYRPTIVFVHADALLSRRVGALESVLSWDLFRETDVLLCCGQQFYDRHLKYKSIATRVIALDTWNRKLQLSVTRTLLGSDTARALRAWLDGAPERQQLCAVPLHLVLVLSQIVEPETLDGIGTRRELFERVAELRFAREGGPFHVEDQVRELGAVAHRFYRHAKATSGEPIRFTRADLRRELEARGHADATHQWADWLEYHTVLVGSHRPNELRFEHPYWGWFFVARHISETLRDSPRDTLQAFEKFLSSDVMILLEEMLREAVEWDPEPIRRALREALLSKDDGRLASDGRRVAREQVAYFLGALGHEAIRDELHPLLDPDSPQFEKDHWVRRAIMFGLADGRMREYADLYVGALRGELDSEGPTPQRDTNIGFYLSFRGDQQFELGRLDEIIGRKPASCRKTVAELVRGLTEDHHAGSWRIKLFTLVDLGRHPKVSRESYRDAIKSHVATLEQINDRLCGDPETSWWPELPELEKVLSGVAG